MGKQAKGSLTSRNLKYKLRMAFILMSVFPLLVCLYIVSNYIVPTSGWKIDISAIVLISSVIAIGGFFVIKSVFDRVVAICTEARLIVAGDVHRKLTVGAPDEVGEIGSALNLLTTRIRTNMDELRSYSEKTTEINLEIQKRVLVLSGLLQISSLIAQSAKLEEILKVITEKARLLANSDVAYLLFRDEGQEAFTVKTVDGVNTSYLLGIRVLPSEEVFYKTVHASQTLVLDKRTTHPRNINALFCDKFNLKNTLAIPVFLNNRVTAIMGIANNREDFIYRKEDGELLDVFAKQVAIAVENEILLRRVEKLEIKDALTGLYNAAYIKERLQDEIRRAIACQRPCALVLLDVDNFKDFHERFGSLQSEGALKKIAALIKETVRDIDRVGRTGDNEFAILLPEKNKRKAHEIAEEIRKKIEFTYGEDPDIHRRLTVCGGVSENPLDGTESEELIKKAKDLLIAAKKNGKNRITAF